MSHVPDHPKQAAAKQKTVVKKQASMPMAKTGKDVVVRRSVSGVVVVGVGRLTDAKTTPVVKRVIGNATSSPENARKYLVRLGTLTQAGNVTRKYGGK
jgi:hypothetical protein